MKARFFETSNREDWTGEYKIRDAATSALIDLTGATITLSLKRLGYVVTINQTSGITIAGTGLIRWTIPVSTMSDLAPGNYAVGCVMTRDGSTTQVFSGALPVIDGVTP